MLRSDPERVRSLMERRRKPALLDELDRCARLDLRLRDIVKERDEARAAINDLSKQVAALRRSGDGAGADAAMTESRRLGEVEKVLESEHDEVGAALREVLLVLPNLLLTPHVAWSSRQARQRLVATLAEHLRAYAEERA